MTEIWVAVAVVGVATIAIRASGPVLLGEHGLPAPLANVADLLAPAVLSALVVTQAFASGEELVVDERAAGLLAAGLVVAARGPILGAALAAAVTTALLRAL